MRLLNKWMSIENIIKYLALSLVFNCTDGQTPEYLQVFERVNGSHPLYIYIIQICHASGGNMMECFPEGGWFSRGRSPRENHPPEGKHSIMLPHTGMAYLFYYTEQTRICNLNKARSQMTGDSPRSPLGVASGNGQHEALTDGIRQHDDCSLLSQPITAYDLQVRYNK